MRLITVPPVSPLSPCNNLIVPGGTDDQNRVSASVTVHDTLLGALVRILIAEGPLRLRTTAAYRRTPLHKLDLNLTHRESFASGNGVHHTERLKWSLTDCEHSAKFGGRALGIKTVWHEITIIPLAIELHEQSCVLHSYGVTRVAGLTDVSGIRHLRGPVELP